MHLSPEEIGAPFARDIGGQAWIDSATDGLVTANSANVVVDVDKPGEKLTLMLPFALVDTTRITFEGGLARTLIVGCDLKGSVGRFCVDATFDEWLLGAGAATTPQALDGSSGMSRTGAVSRRGLETTSRCRLGWMGQATTFSLCPSLVPLPSSADSVAFTAASSNCKAASP